jgi:hypothetical protein
MRFIVAMGGDVPACNSQAGPLVKLSHPKGDYKVKRFFYVGVVLSVLVSLVVMPASAATPVPQKSKPSVPPVVQVKARTTLPIPDGLTVTSPCTTPLSFVLAGKVDVDSHLAVHKKSKITGTIAARAVLSATETISNTTFRVAGVAEINAEKLRATTLPITLPSLKVKLDLRAMPTHRKPAWRPDLWTGTLTLTNVIISDTITADPITAASFKLNCPKEWGKKH